MPEFMLLIYTEPGSWQALSEDERKALYQEYYALSDDLQARGAYVASHELQPSAGARTIRIRDGERLMTDGPYAETKEVLGGYYLIDCASLDEALDWAARIPSARYGRVEVRPVAEEGVDLRAPRSSSG